MNRFLFFFSRMKLCWSLALIAVALLMILTTTRAEADLWEEDDKEVLVRTVRGTKERSECFFLLINPLPPSTIATLFYRAVANIDRLYI